MNSYYIAIAKRADHRCEYCQYPELVARQLWIRIGLFP
jgi:hypothetical protein